MVVDVDVNGGDMEKGMRKGGGENVSEMSLFDVQSGKEVEEGKKRLGLWLSLEWNDKRLSDGEIDGGMEKMVGKVEKDLNGNVGG